MNFKACFSLPVLAASAFILSSCFLMEEDIDHPLGEEYRVGKDAVAPDSIKVEDINAIIRTSEGDIGIKLYASKVPMTTANFLNLAKHGFYDGLTFHRVVPDFVIQGGDPTGTGMGGPGYKFRDEFRNDLRHSGPGILSMANSGPDTNGSQFFITHKAVHPLDGRHSVFGEVTSGLDVVYKIKKGDKIKSIKILNSTDDLFRKEKRNISTWNQFLNH